MNLSYITIYDPHNVSNWSGLGYYMAQSLQQQGLALDFVGPLHQPGNLIDKLKRNAYRRLLGSTYLADRNPAVVRYYAEQVQQKLRHSDADVLFSPGTLPAALVHDSRPLVVWTDATFDGMIDFYPGFSRLSAESLRHGRRLEQLALDRCALAIYSSDWAAQTAMKHYKVSPDKVRVVPFGANLNEERTLAAVNESLAAKDNETCKLLFLGIDWFRKGGPKAFEIARCLNERGIATELWVAGCEPQLNQPRPAWLKPLGFISKHTAAGRDQLVSLLKQAHFLVLPSEADCTPVAFSEANALGLPVITTDVGGIPTIVRDDVNGKKFSLATSGAGYADYIEQVFADQPRYAALCRTAFREYDTRLNWTVSARTVKNLMSTLVS